MSQLRRELQGACKDAKVIMSVDPVSCAGTLSACQDHASLLHVAVGAAQVARAHGPTPARSKTTCLRRSKTILRRKLKSKTRPSLEVQATKMSLWAIPLRSKRGSK